MGARGNRDTRRRKRKERKKRKAAQKRSTQQLVASAQWVNEWRACVNCQKSFFAISARKIRCADCVKKYAGYGFEKKKRQALAKYRERKAAEEGLDRELLVKVKRVYDPY